MSFISDPFAQQHNNNNNNKTLTFAIKLYLTIWASVRWLVCSLFEKLGAFAFGCQWIYRRLCSNHRKRQTSTPADRALTSWAADGGACDSDNQPEHKTSKCQQSRDHMIGSVRYRRAEACQWSVSLCGLRSAPQDPQIPVFHIRVIGCHNCESVSVSQTLFSHKSLSLEAWDTHTHTNTQCSENIT